MAVVRFSKNTAKGIWNAFVLTCGFFIMIAALLVPRLGTSIGLGQSSLEHEGVAYADAPGCGGCGSGGCGAVGNGDGCGCSCSSCGGASCGACGGCDAGCGNGACGAAGCAP